MGGIEKEYLKYMHREIIMHVQIEAKKLGLDANLK